MIDSYGKMTNRKLYCNVLQLPICSMLSNGNQVVIDVSTDSEISDMYQLIKCAAKTGDGFGVDEYPTEQYFRNEIKDGHNFFVTLKNCGEMVAAFSLVTSKFYRGQDWTYADPIIVVKNTERGTGIGEFIFQQVVFISKRLGYLGLYVDTFSNNEAMMKIIERHPGFQRVGHFPVGGMLPDGTVVTSYIYYKDLRNLVDDTALSHSTHHS